MKDFFKDLKGISNALQKAIDRLLLAAIITAAVLAAIGLAAYASYTATGNQALSVSVATIATVFAVFRAKRALHQYKYKKRRK